MNGKKAVNNDPVNVSNIWKHATPSIKTHEMEQRNCFIKTIGMEFYLSLRASKRLALLTDELFQNAGYVCICMWTCIQ